MTQEPFVDLIEYHGTVPHQDLKRISMADYIKQHETRWVMHLSIGDVVLKFLGQLDMDRIAVETANDNPEYLDLLNRAATLSEFEKLGVPLDAEHQTELADVARNLIPFQRAFQRGCFVEYVCPRCLGTGRIRQATADCPQCKGSGTGNYEKALFTSLNHFDAFLCALQKEEVDKLYRVLAVLSSNKPMGEVSDLMVVLSQEFNIPLSSTLTADNMTAQQASVLTQVLEKKAEMMQKAARKAAQDAQQ